MGTEPTEEAMPVDWDQIPVTAQYAIHIYNKLGNRLQAEMGFIGKDYTNLPLLLELYDVESTELTIDILKWLEDKDAKASADHIKKIHDKAKKGSSSAPTKTRGKPSFRA